MLKQSFSVGDCVYCSHAQAKGFVCAIYEFNILVIVTATYGTSNYSVGNTYAWMPMQLVPIATLELN